MNVSLLIVSDRFCAHSEFLITAILHQIIKHSRAYVGQPNHSIMMFKVIKVIKVIMIIYQALYNTGLQNDMDVSMNEKYLDHF